MLTLLEAPVPFVTVGQAKKHLSIPASNTRDDDMIEAQIKAAIGYLDGPRGYLGSAISPQKWKFQASAFSTPMLHLPLGPIISLDAMSYRDREGATVLMDLSTVYLFGDSMGPYLCPIGTWPSDVGDRPGGISIELTVGYAEVPPQLVSAVLLIVGQMYRFREISVEERNFPTGFSMFDLAHPYRVSF